jgi:hypothetical protein
MVDADKNSCNEFFKGYVTRCFVYESETKRQSSEYVGETSLRPKKLKDCADGSYFPNNLRLY